MQAMLGFSWKGAMLLRKDRRGKTLWIGEVFMQLSVCEDDAMWNSLMRKNLSLKVITILF